MSISIYRNILNREMKRFGRFGKIIVEEVGLHGISIKLVYNAIKEVCLKEMLDSETLIIISHGSSNSIYHRLGHGKMDDQILLEKKNLRHLKGKKIIAISCGTARNLGPEAYNSGEGCKVYLGFLNKIHFTKKNNIPASIKYHVFIGDCYKEVFHFVIREAILNNWNFEKIKAVMEIELMRTVTSKAIKIQNEKPLFYRNHGIGQAILAVSNVANNIKLFGNGKERIN